MIDFFKGLVNFISVTVDFFVAMITNLIHLLGDIPKVMTSMTAVFSLLPPFLTVPLLALISVSVLVTVLNKWG